VAAVIACVPISGNLPGGQQAIDVATVRDGIARYYQGLGASVPNWVGAMVGGKLGYSWAHTRIVLEDWKSTPRLYDVNEDITVRVYHDYALLEMPGIGRLFGAWSAQDGAYLSTVSAACTMLNEGVSDVIKEDAMP
jgi:hypothetical protein